MPEPGLNDITNMTVDSSRGTGTPATIYDNRELGRLLNDNAQFKARNDWNKYNLFLGNLKDVYKDLNEIAKQPVLEEDMPKLRSEMADIIKSIGSDPKSFFGGGPKFNEINGKITELQGQATESKGNRLFDTAHREFFYRNPELETKENKDKIEGFRKQPLGSRTPYQLSMPGLVDLDALAKTINANVKKEEAYSRPTADNQFIEKGKSIVYDPVKFGQLAEAAYEQNDSRNIPVRETMQKRFEALPDYLKQEVQQQYKGSKDPVKAWFVDDLKKRIMADSETKDDLVPNPGYLEEEKLAQKALNDKRELAVKWANYGLAKDRLNKSDLEDLSSADSVINEARDIISKGQEVKVDIGGGKTETRLRIGDPTLLQRFGNIDKDGKVTNVPDAIEYDKNKDQVKLIYYAKDKTYSGKNFIEKEVPLDQRTWLKEITRRSFPNKEIGSINTLIDDVLKKNGNSLYKLTQVQPDKSSGSEVAGDVDVSTLSDGDYTISSGKNKGKVVTIKGGSAVSIK